jgi:hypothetical protein
MVIDLDQLQFPNPGLKSETLSHPLKMGSGTVGRHNKGLLGKRKGIAEAIPFLRLGFDSVLELDAQRQLQHAGSIV